LVASLIKLAGLDWPVPDYTRLCRRQKTLVVELDGRPSSGGLRLLVDSTGIKMTGEGEWKTRKHGASYRRQWRQVHLGIDAYRAAIWGSSALLVQLPGHSRANGPSCRDQHALL
jgi:IS5 family transposase